MISIEAPARIGELIVERHRVGWAEWGAIDGTPVVFCTGAGMTSSFGFGFDALRPLGVRLVCIDRAGLGRSAPDPDKSLSSYAADVAAVLSHLGISRAPAIGFSQGGPFAVALAATGVVSRLALVAATDELAHPSMRSLLVSDVARMVDWVSAGARDFEAAFAKQVDPEGLWALVLGMSAPGDRVTYEQPAFAAAYRQSLCEGFAQGPEGYVRDVVLATTVWPTPPETITIPVSLWYGALDTSPVHSPDAGATLARRFPNATRRVFPSEGGALLWTRSREILSELVAATSA